MELRELRYFVAVAETGSFSRAAAKLGVTQPTLSRQIRTLETEFGTPLFYRDGRGVQPTDAGQRLHEAIVPLLRHLDDVHDEIVESSHEPTGLVRFGVPPSIGSTLGAPVVAKFQDAAPRAHIHLFEAFSGTLLEWVEAGTIDLAVLYDARRQPNMLATPVLLEDLFVIGPPVPTEAVAPIELQTLASEVFMLPGQGNGLRRVLDAAFESAGLRLQVRAEIDSTAVLKQLVEMKITRTILPFGAVHREVFDGRLSAHPLASQQARAKLVLATTLNRPITKATRLLIDLVKQELARCLEAGILKGIPAPAT